MINIAPGDLAAALEILAKQSGVEFVYSAEQVKGLRTRGVEGEFTAKEAVIKLLEGTRLIIASEADAAILIAPEILRRRRYKKTLRRTLRMPWKKSS